MKKKKGKKKVKHKDTASKPHIRKMAVLAAWLLGTCALTANGRGMSPLTTAASTSLTDSTELSFNADSAQLAPRELTDSIAPWTRNLDRPFEARQGLEGRHIALWGSHGLYYELGNARWEWQRARLFQAVEDKFPTSFVLKYLVPMLENAGAVVMMPRERDANPYEVVVDNDGKLATSAYRETNGQEAWANGQGKGFAYDRAEYRDGVNPFEQGTYRMAQSVSDESQASRAVWTPTIPMERRYAVYVSYQSLPNSTDDARYTIWHKGGHTTIAVNQQMGGGTWVYLGTFTFAAGQQGRVELSNLSQTAGTVVTADAVRFGGGMGNVARGANGNLVYDNTKKKKAKAESHARSTWQPRLDIPYEVSGAPRWVEGSRYYLQWAGMPMSVYSSSNGQNDYTDDFKSRALWVNQLAGGSRSLPGARGMNVPIDLSFAFHTDGGAKAGNSMIGTLGIYYTTENGGKLGNGTSTSASRELSNSIYDALMHDLAVQMEPKWVGRKCVDKNYNEAAQPRVPTMLLELMSHENFAEMRYGLDPRFKFVASRAIYKGMLRFMSQRYGYDYVVQPLPVSQFAATLTSDKRARLQWCPVADSLEATATPERYVVYKRIGNTDFDNGTVVDSTFYECEIPTDQVVSFRVTALNRGGQSLPSETLSIGISSQSAARPILVINGFDRISAPDDFVAGDDKQAGFLAYQDNGVEDGYKLDYAGAQKEFERAVKWTDDDAPGHGSSTGEHEYEVIAGNTFDYPALHGRSILRSGHSFVSVSRSALDTLMSSDTTLHVTYAAIDLILGKQKQSKLGRPGVHPLSFKTFDGTMQRLLTQFCKAGGPVFVSGSYVASDLWQNPLARSVEADKKFATSILKYQWREDKATKCGAVKSVASPLAGMPRTLAYHNAPNEESYEVESPDAIIAADPAAVEIFRYADNGKPAGIAFAGNATDHWRTVVLGFPFESVKDAPTRDKMMKSILDYLCR